jgi:hypothetical protein
VTSSARLPPYPSGIKPHTEFSKREKKNQAALLVERDEK